MAYEDVSFRDSAGLLLRGWWVPATGNRTVVMIHGWTSSRAETTSKSVYLHAAGYNLLLFDLRGHGTSDGSYTTMGFAEPADISSAVSFARQRAPTAPIALLGYSMGGALAVEAGARNPDVAAVIEDSGYGSLSAVIATRFSQVTRLPSFLDAGMLAIERLDLGFEAGAVRPAGDATHLHKPLLAIIGTADTMVPPAQGESIYRAAAGPRQLLLIPGAGHVGGFLKDPALYQRTVLSFLATSLQT